MLEPDVINHIEGDTTIWEQDPLRHLASDGQLTSYHHHGFWQPWILCEIVFLLKTFG